MSHFRKADDQADLPTRTLPDRRWFRELKAELVELLEEVTFIGITDDLVAEAAELAKAEALRAYDAIHLAAALVIEASGLTSADGALCQAAERRGLHVAGPPGA
ncbi:MAG: hypothetical protein JJLCMIEE_03275 [Acidimicrobiales bacterium]|nr:hypothetical protein [Acidimicrobiales bacterium]